MTKEDIVFLKKKIEEEVLDSNFFLLIEIELHDGKKKV
jgi:hypothetical protein